MWLGGSLKAINGPYGFHDVKRLKMATVTDTALQKLVEARDGHYGCQDNWGTFSQDCVVRGIIKG